MSVSQKLLLRSYHFVGTAVRFWGANMIFDCTARTFYNRPFCNCLQVFHAFPFFNDTPLVLFLLLFLELPRFYSALLELMSLSIALAFSKIGVTKTALQPVS